MNIAGELLDLEAGGRVADELDPRISDGIVDAYRNLWKELTGSESFGVPIAGASTSASTA